MYESLFQNLLYHGLIIMIYCSSCPIVTPHEVLQTSGHVDRFCGKTLPFSTNIYGGRN